MFRNLRSRKTLPVHASKPAATPSDTIIGSGASLQGTLTSEGNVRVYGTSNGDITAEGDVLIGETARVEGNITGKTVAVGGIVRGDIEAMRISLLRTGRVWGDLTTSSLTTEEGGFIQGVITMQSKEAGAEAEDDIARLPAELEAQVAEAVKAAEKKPKK